MDINSPGGFSVGGAEIADAIFKSAKPTVAWVGGMMCSLAYWIGSQAKAVISARSAYGESAQTQLNEKAGKTGSGGMFVS